MTNDTPEAVAAKLTKALRKIAEIKDPAGDSSKFGFGGLRLAQKIARDAILTTEPTP